MPRVLGCSSETNCLGICISGTGIWKIIACLCLACTVSPFPYPLVHFAPQLRPYGTTLSTARMTIYNERCEAVRGHCVGLGEFDMRAGVSRCIALHCIAKGLVCV